MSAWTSPARRCYVIVQVIVIVHALSIGAVQVRAQEYAVTNLSLGGSFTEVTDMNESGQTVGWATTTGNVYQRAFIAGRNGTHDLGTLGGAHSYAYGVNEAGQVVGYAQTASGHYHAFLYDGTTMHDLGTLGGLESRAYGINDAGQIVGFAQTASGYFHAFLYDGITMHDLGTLGGNNSYASRINAAGQVVGSSQTASGQDYLFFYDGTTMHPLAFAGVPSQFITSAVVTGFNDSGDVVGYRRPGLFPPPDYHAFLYDGTMRDLGTLGGSYSYASGNPSSQIVNEAGQVVGYAQTASGQQHAFLYDGTTMRDLGTFGGTFSFANAINEAGHVVGVAQTASSDQHAFLYDGTTMHDLGTFGGPFSGATDINQAGQVVGAASDMTNTWSAFLYDGTVIRNLNDHLTNPPAGIHLLQVVRIADNGSMVARSNAGWVLLSNSSNAHAPTVGPISLDVDPVPSGTTVSASAAFTDAEAADTHTADWTWGDSSSSPGIVSESDGAGEVAGTHIFSTAGIYSVSLTVTDSTGLTGHASRDIVVYDPSAGFVTGGGWIMSPRGAYRPAPTLEGPATFGFVSKYVPGSHVPTGKTEFEFRAANLHFHSNDYDWLVVAGARAQYKGTGAMNSVDGYEFMLTAVDGDVHGKKKEDRFRMKIWYHDLDLKRDIVVYDNLTQPETVGTLSEGTLLGGGSIAIHSR